MPPRPMIRSIADPSSPCLSLTLSGSGEAQKPDNGVAVDADNILEEQA